MHAQAQASDFARRPDSADPQWAPLVSALLISAHVQGSTPVLETKNAKSSAAPRAAWNLMTRFRVVDGTDAGQGGGIRPPN